MLIMLPRSSLIQLYVGGSIDLFRSYENMVHFGVLSRIYKKAFNRTKFLTFE